MAELKQIFGRVEHHLEVVSPWAKFRGTQRKNERKIQERFDSKYARA